METSFDAQTSANDSSVSESTTREKDVRSYSPTKQLLLKKIKRLQSANWKLLQQLTTSKPTKGNDKLKLSTNSELVEAVGKYLTPLQKLAF